MEGLCHLPGPKFLPFVHYVPMGLGFPELLAPIFVRDASGERLIADRR